MDGATRETLLYATATLIRVLVCKDAVLADAFDSNGTSSVRAIVPLASVGDRKELQAWARTRGVRLSVKHADPIDLYLWAFGGLVGPACMDADKKALLRVSLKGARLVRTIGSFYSPMTAEELAAHDNEEHAPAKCPVCRDHDLLMLALADRHEESIESAESRYPQVDWGAEREQLFVVGRSNLTHKSSAVDEDGAAKAILAPSPPW
jgi:hypothetical protein